MDYIQTHSTKGALGMHTPVEREIRCSVFLKQELHAAMRGLPEKRGQPCPGSHWINPMVVHTNEATVKPGHIALK
jgi:hypothetical protein